MSVNMNVYGLTSTLAEATRWTTALIALIGLGFDWTRKLWAWTWRGAGNDNGNGRQYMFFLYFSYFIMPLNK